MALYVRVNCNFFSHRKTAKLRGLIGDAGLWLPPRWWAYAAENQPDGVFSNYTAAELAGLLGYQKDPEEMLQALLQAGFADANPLRIHDWHEHNGYHQVFAERAKKAAAARWEKERSKEKGEDSTRGEKSQALLQASKPADRQVMLGKSPPPLPSQLPGLIADVKAKIKNTPTQEDDVLDALWVKLGEYEAQKFGVPVTKRKPKPTKPQPHGTREPLKKFQPCPELAQNFRAEFAKEMEAAQPG